MCGLLLQTEYRGLSVGLSVVIVSPARTAEPIEMPLGLRTLMGPGNHVGLLDGGPDLSMERGNFRGGAAHCK